MKQEKKDRRIRKTEKQLLNGLTCLMQTKSINDITVRELAELIDINRSTFYLHYQDIYDMIKHIEDDLIQQFTEVIGPAGMIEREFTEHNEYAVKVIKSIFDFLFENRVICKALLGHNGDIKFLNKVNNIIYERIQFLLKNYSKGKYSEFDLELMTNYVVSGCIGLVQYWLNCDDKVIALNDSNHMANLFINLMKSSAFNYNNMLTE